MSRDSEQGYFMTTREDKRKFPIGAEILQNSARGVHFRVWAPEKKKVAVVLEDRSSSPSSQTFVNLEADDQGYFSGTVKDCQAGSLYRFKLDDDSNYYPDPASRYQPEGPHGPSQVIDPATFRWTDQKWKGLVSKGPVIYEMHIGTFTIEGTWNSARKELLELAELGITVIEMMPINQFPGKFGWGYDGINAFAPHHAYGTPDDLRNFIDHAHALGIAVILDVVYNHFGPDGNYFRTFSEEYFTTRYLTEWGEAINFDGKQAKSVREYFIANAGYWIEEYHFDGLRLDATQSIYDYSSTHILAEISEEVRRRGAHRKTYLIAENEKQQIHHVTPVKEGGFGLDALWNDDFHHTAMVRLTGHHESYYSDYRGMPQEFISTVKYGYLYQGQWYSWQKKARGTSSFHLDPSAFINFTQNHDQVANSAHGLRLHQLSDPGNYRAMTSLLLLAPNTPLLFQGQEFAASTPFYYFADHSEELSPLVFKGRLDYFKQFPSIHAPEVRACLPSPSAFETFSKCKLDFSERKSHSTAYALHRDLLKLRHNDSIFSQPRRKGVDGAVLNHDAFALRYFGENEDTRLVIINFGNDLFLNPCPEPLLAPPTGTSWAVAWSSEDARYGGSGTPPFTMTEKWIVVGHSAIIFIPQKEG